MIVSVLKVIFIVAQPLGLIIIMISLWRMNRTFKEHSKTSDDDFLSETEKEIQNKSIKILIIGISISVITLIIQSFVFFYLRWQL